MFAGMSDGGRETLPSGRTLAFVTVVYEAEYELLVLQARSMAKYLPLDLVDEIIVIDNSSRGIPGALREQLLVGYGDLASLVRFVRSGSEARVAGAIGWWSQQVLKLTVVDQIHTDKYVALDAKNQFVATARLSNFVSGDGRSRVNTHSYESHRLRPDLENVLAYLGVDPAPHVANFTMTTTPFVFDAAMVRELVSGVQARSGRSIGHEMVSKGLTEFFLYTGWIIASGRSLSDVYEVENQNWPTVWPHSARSDGVRRAIDAAGPDSGPIFSVHRRALGVLDADSAGLLAEFWTSRGLFATLGDAAAFIAQFQESYESEAARQRRRDLPNKLIRAPRSLGRRLGRVIARRGGGARA